MTDRVKEMAREAIGPHEGQHDSPVEWCTTCRCLMEGVDALIADALRVYAEEARQEEREACATIAEHTEIVLNNDPFRRWSVSCEKAAKAIRARGEGKR